MQPPNRPGPPGQPPHGQPPQRPPAPGAPRPVTVIGSGIHQPGAQIPAPPVATPPAPGGLSGALPAASPPVQAPSGPLAAAPAGAPGRPRRFSLRFAAGTFIFSGWATLVISLILTAVTTASAFGATVQLARAGAGSSNYFPGNAAPSLPPGTDPAARETLENLGFGGGGTSAGPFSTGLNLWRQIGPVVLFGSAVLTLLTGAVTCIILLGLGQACYLLLDLEARMEQNASALSTILSRLGPRPG